MTDQRKQNNSFDDSFNLRYGLEDKPPVAETALYAFQWLAISLPFIVIVGAVAAGQHSDDPALKTLYLQKAAFISGLMLLGQALLGHRLTLIAGPSAALLLGLIGSPAGPDAVYTALAVCGLLLAVISAAGLFQFLGKLFTPRVIATVLLLIAFTLMPTIVRLLTSGNPGSAQGELAFAACFVTALFLAHRFMSAAGRALLVIFGMIGGTVAFFGIFGFQRAPDSQPAFASLFHGMTTPVFDAGALLSVLFCFLALSLNEIGSMQAITPLLKPDKMDKRMKRGMTMTGCVNAAAGMLGVIGPVDYSLTSGVIASGGVGSRRPLVPAALLLVLVSFSPMALGLAEMIPNTVVACMLIYTMSGQIAAGFYAALADKSFSFEDGLVVGLPLMAGTIISILPPQVVASLPDTIRSVAGNGFVIGVIAVLFLDRLFSRRA